MTHPIHPALYETLREFVAEVHDDVERFALDRAYQVAGGPLLSIATRIGWPQADVFLSFVMAVRALANANRGGTLTFPEAMEQYEQRRAVLDRLLATPLPPK